MKFSMSCCFYDAVATNIAIQGSFGLQEYRYWASKV